MFLFCYLVVTATSTTVAATVTAEKNKCNYDDPKALVILEEIAKASHFRTSSFHFSRSLVREPLLPLRFLAFYRSLRTSFTFAPLLIWYAEKALLVLVFVSVFNCRCSDRFRLTVRPRNSSAHLLCSS